MMLAVLISWLNDRLNDRLNDKVLDLELTPGAMIWAGMYRFRN